MLDGCTRSGKRLPSVDDAMTCINQTVKSPEAIMWIAFTQQLPAKMHQVSVVHLDTCFAVEVSDAVHKNHHHPAATDAFLRIRLQPLLDNINSTSQPQSSHIQARVQLSENGTWCRPGWACKPFIHTHMGARSRHWSCFSDRPMTTVCNLSQNMKGGKRRRPAHCCCHDVKLLQPSSCRLGRQISYRIFFDESLLRCNRHIFRFIEENCSSAKPCFFVVVAQQLTKFWLIASAQTGFHTLNLQPWIRTFWKAHN